MLHCIAMLCEVIFNAAEHFYVAHNQLTWCPLETTIINANVSSEIVYGSYSYAANGHVSSINSLAD